MRQVLPLHSFPPSFVTARSLSARSLIRHSASVLAAAALFLLSSGSLGVILLQWSVYCLLFKLFLSALKKATASNNP